MPEISRFLGIVTGMFHREHGPPHFHAVYAEHKMAVDIGLLSNLTGHTTTYQLPSLRQDVKMSFSDVQLETH